MIIGIFKEPFEKWSEWSQCKGLEKEENGEKCGTGQKTRKRKCQKWIKKEFGNVCGGEREILVSLWKSFPIKAKFMIIQVPNSEYQNNRAYDEIGL